MLGLELISISHGCRSSVSMKSAPYSSNDDCNSQCVHYLPHDKAHMMTKVRAIRSLYDTAQIRTVSVRVHNLPDDNFDGQYMYYLPQDVAYIITTFGVYDSVHMMTVTV